MSTIGIVAEYNPFHNGHLYHLNKSKQVTNSQNCIVVMSPNFVQRGEMSILDKWTRTKTALLSGADIVIELPTVYANSSAEFFANYSVSLLNSTGIVDYLCFGSENNNINLLKDLAKILVKEPLEFQQLLKDQLDLGINFPSARAKALMSYCSIFLKLDNVEEIENVLSAPNNILSIEYLKALYKLNSNILPITIKRLGAGYHSQSIQSGFSSATAIRKSIYLDDFDSVEKSVPRFSYNSLKSLSHDINQISDILFNFLSYRLLFSTPSDLQRIFGINEGLENRILNTFESSYTYYELVSGIKSKRFTQTTIQRILINILLQIQKDDINTFEDSTYPPYIRVLGFRRNSSNLISDLQKNSKSPVILNLKKDYSKLSDTGKAMLDIEIRSTNIYSKINKYKFNANNQNLDFIHPLVII